MCVYMYKLVLMCYYISASTFVCSPRKTPQGLFRLLPGVRGLQTRKLPYYLILLMLLFCILFEGIFPIWSIPLITEVSLSIMNQNPSYKPTLTSIVFLYQFYSLYRKYHKHMVIGFLSLLQTQVDCTDVFWC